MSESEDKKFGKFIWDKEQKKFVPYEEYRAPETHYVMTDEMAPLGHPADGKVYTSKKKFRNHTKELGLLEIGNEKLPSGPYIDRYAAEKRKRACIDAFQIHKEDERRRKQGKPPCDRTWRTSRVND